MNIAHLAGAWTEVFDEVWGSVLNSASVSASSLTLVPASASAIGVAGVASVVVKAGYWVLCGLPQPRERR